MPSKKKKYNARFPAGRIKKIMQTDEEVGKVAQAVPVIISRTLELFVESLLTKSMQITQARNAKTLTPSHMKQCILSESRFDFLKDLVKNVPDPSAQEDNENDAGEVLDYSLSKSSENSQKQDKSDIVANFYVEQGPSVGRTPVIQYGPSVTQMEKPKLSFSIDSLVSKEVSDQKVYVELAKAPTTPVPSSSQTQAVPHLVPSVNSKPIPAVPASTIPLHDNVPPLIPISRNNTFPPNSGDNNLYIDEDYDN
ncbi:dr1-associated corepressor [Photinus pyralis]|uniref:Transcription factor CBF/NF-Y/archaeal histone domain-containing protein n=1 Tax=Photinus pyralis TaxID=7054 RepID=A0A1Y1MF00_PHOPY|nr:dr1-associated corepressor [Photinus pyralis]